MWRKNHKRPGGRAIDGRTTRHPRLCHQPKKEANRRVLRVVEDHCADAQAAAPWGLQVDWVFTFACAAYNLVRMRNLAAAAPAV